MKQFKGTPGPWHLNIPPRDLSGQTRNACITDVDTPDKDANMRIWGRVWSDSEEIDLANYQLAASAPELLELLIEAQKVLISEGMGLSLIEAIDITIDKALTIHN